MSAVPQEVKRERPKMTSTAMKIVAAIAVTAAIYALGTPSYADVTGRPHDLGLTNPQGHCLNCHDLHQVELGEGYEHNLKRANEIAVCYQCHAGTLNNYSSIDPSMPDGRSLYSQYDVKGEFSQAHSHFSKYGMDGEHNKCSECHNPHGVFDAASTTRKPKLLSAGPDVVTDTDEYCFVCHNKDAGAPHSPFSNISVGAQYRFSRNIYRQMTHSTFFRGADVTEPVPDTAHTYDDNPYGAGKDISCLTCHRPHGSPNEHMLIQPDNQGMCLACHNGSKAGNLTEFTVSGHGKPGAGRICQDCHFPHGTGQENAVKTSIKDPHTGTMNAVNVTGGGMNEACFACHNAASTSVYTNDFATSASTSGWGNFYYTGFAWDNTVGHSGTGSLRQTLTSDYLAYDNCSQRDITGILPNTQYTFSGYVFIPQPLSGGNAFLRVTEYPAEYSYSGIKDNVITGDRATYGQWKYQSITFTTTANTTWVRIRLKMAGSGTVYWDDLKFSATPYVSGYFPGKTGYNAGIHKTSPNSHSPRDASGDQAAGDCGNCHNPHGKGNYKMLAAPGETLCYDCHNGTTHNTADGRDVQAEFALTSHHNLSKVKCSDCHNVHTATQSQVMADPLNNQAAMTDKTAFCLGCHLGSMPSDVTGAPDLSDEWPNGGHNKNRNIGCPDCHASHGSVNPGNINYAPKTYNGYTARFEPGMEFISRSFCEACHNRSSAGYKGATRIPLGAGYVGQHGEGDDMPCANCHSRMHDPTVANYTTGVQYYTIVCLNCHKRGAGNPYPETAAQFNMATSASSNVSRSVHDITYSPPSTVDCVKCHGDDHEADHNASSRIIDPDKAHPTAKSLDINSSSAFCLQCHDGTPVTLGGRTPANIMDTYTTAGHGTASARTACASCHAYHGTANSKLIRTAINGKGVLPNYSGNNTSVCTACHGGTEASLPYWPGYEVYSGSVHAYGNRTTGNLVTDGRHGTGVCVNCHNPHGVRVGGKTTPGMLDKDGEALCYICHNGTTPNTASGEDVQAAFAGRTHHRISDADQIGPDNIPGTADDAKIECTDCHDPHTITERLMAYRDISGKVRPVEADQEFCLKCHSATPQQGVKYPAEGVWDKSEYVNSAHGNHLKRIKTFSNYSNAVVYPCKVCHHPHGSDQNAQQRDSWDINRDGIPDDIDGDGILDSSTMVGFIGYSTGTRKAILVNTTTGIPSRAGFKRISTTIPYQGNGSIDVEICFNCHDGSPAPDVKTDFSKASHHDVTYADQVADNSRIECYNCHDQHRAQARDDSKAEYSTTDPYAPRKPMPGDAPFCLRCHDNTLPPGVSFGSKRLKNIKLSYNPTGRADADGYDVITTSIGHFSQTDRKAMYCRECHNQHGSSYPKMLRDNTEPGKPGYDASQPIQRMQPVALSVSDPYGGGDALPLTSTSEHCLACHSGVTTFNGNLIPLPPPPDSASRGFTMSPVAMHTNLASEVTETGGHLYGSSFAVSVAPGSVKDECTKCHDSHNPYIATVDGQLMDCYQCHNENTSLPDVQSEFNDNPTNPSRSKSIHPVKYDPTGTTPLYVECLKCHDQSKHMGRVVRLRKDPSRFANYTSDADVLADPVRNRTINQFCLECHDPNTTVASSFWRGGTEHVPPRLPAGHAGGAHFVNGTLLCTDCHEYHGSTNNGLRKNARGDEETFCYSCHSDPAKSKNGVNVQAKFTGTASHHQVSASEQAAKGSKVECEDCHNVHVVTRPSPVVRADDRNTAAPSDTVFCIGCHDSGGGAGVKFPGYAEGTSAPEWETATGKWNKWDKGVYAGSAHDAASVQCKGCHDPHGSANYALLLRNISSSTNVSVGFGVHSTVRGKRKEELGVNAICKACHKSSDGVYEGYANFTSQTFGHKRGVDKNCTYCHNPHGSGQQKMMRSDKPLYMNMTSATFGSVYNFKGFANHTTGAPYYTFCSSAGCHVSERSQLDTFNMDLLVDNFTRDETKSSHHPIKEGVMGCTSCHNEHGSSYAPDLRAAFFRESNWPKLYHSGRGVYSTRHGGGCGNADPFDGTDYFESWVATNRNKVVTVSPPSDADNLCYMCHQKDDIIGDATAGMAGTNTKFIGHEAVKGGAKVSHDISPGGNGIGSDYHNFSCSACHFPHSSSRGKLMKQGCFSQSDGQSPSSGRAIWGCHSYKKWGNFNAGWRNLTTAAKADFGRPPNPVTNLSASLDTDLTVRLGWTAVADSSGQGVHHYNVYRSSQSITQAAKPFATRILKGLAGGGSGSAMSWSDYTGQPNTTYYYTVVACDSENNESFVSNCVSVSLGPDTVAPAAISDQQTSQVDGTYNVKVTWHDPGDNVNVTIYKIYRNGVYLASVTDPSNSADGSPDANVYSFTDTTTQLGQSYNYSVYALDAAANTSASPSGLTFSVTVVDPAPASIATLSAKPVSREMKASLTWTAPTNVGAIQGYHVYRKAGSQPELTAAFRVMSSVTATAYTDNVPATATDYYYRVTALDDSSKKESKASNDATVNIPVPPSAVTLTRLSDSDLRVSWSPPAYTTGLNYYSVFTRRGAGAWTPAVISEDLAVNGGFEYGLNGWNPATLTATVDVVDGRACVKLAGTSAGDKYIESSALAKAYPSTTYSYTGYVYVPASLTSGGTYLRIIEYNASGGYITEHTATAVTLTSGWHKMTDTWTTNASTGQLRLRVQLQGVGTAYWDDVRLTPAVAASTSTQIDLTGMEPGTCEVAVAADYGTYGGSTPYESVLSTGATSTLTDSVGTEAVTNLTVSLTAASNYTQARLDWSVPADRNYAGYTPSGVGYYRFQATSDGGASWGTIFRTRLTNPGFESHTGTVDDTTTDSFTDWSSSATYNYAVTDALFDTRALKMRYTGSGDGYITSAEPNTGLTVANQTYSMSFWAKASKDTTFQYFIQANGGNYEAAGLTNTSIGQEWQRFTASGTFSPSATATSARVVIRPSYDATAEITVDGVRLETSTSAILANDGSYYQPDGRDVSGGPQSFDVPKALSAGTAARYRMEVFDAAGNRTAPVYTGTVFAKPTAVTDLKVSSHASTSANVLTFSSSKTLAGLARYRIYAREQATPLSSLTGATLIDTFMPVISSGGNIAKGATATASHEYNSSYPARYSNDENEGTAWYGRNGVGDNWLKVTFPSAVPIYKVKFSFYSSSYYWPTDYRVETNDGTGWVTRASVTGSYLQYPEYTFSEPVNATEVRIYITKTYGGIGSYFPIVNEFTVYAGEKYVHDLHNTALQAKVGHAYAYAVTAEEVNGLVSDMSGGSPTVNTVADRDAPDKVGDLGVETYVEGAGMHALESGTAQVTLTWSTPPDNLGQGTGTGAVSYEVYRLPNTSLPDDNPAPVTDANYTTATLVYSGTYTSSVTGTINTYTTNWYDHMGANFAVRSADSAGNWSVISNSPFIVAGKDVQAPTPPVITDCIPVTSPEVDVYWSPAVDNVGVNGYRLFRADVGVPPFLSDGCITENNVGQAETAVDLISYDAVEAADAGGLPGRTYYYALRAWDDEGNLSNISNCAVATVRTVATDATRPTWSGTPLTVLPQPYPDIDLVWTGASDKDDSGSAGGIDHYNIYRSTSSFSSTAGLTPIATVSGIRNSYVDRTGDHDTTYYYGLVAVDASAIHNQSVLSNVASATVAPAPSPDNTIPQVPAGLAASTGVYPYVNLSWSPSADTDDAGISQPLLCYRLYRSVFPLDITEDNKGVPAEVDVFMVANDATGYVSTGMGGVTYNYRIEAFDMAGNASGLSTQVSSGVASAPCVDTTPPLTPTGLSAVVGPSPDIDLLWTASIDDGGGCAGVIDHYLLYRAGYDIDEDKDGVPDYPLGSLTHVHVAGNSTSYADSSGLYNTPYWYVLTAVDSAGNESSPSNIITRTTAADTMPPAGIRDLKATPTAGIVKLTWCKPADNVGVDHYEIYRKQQTAIMQDADIVPANRLSGFVNQGTCLSFDDSGVTGGHTYSYAVIAVDGAGNRSTISRGEQAGATIAAVP